MKKVFLLSLLTLLLCFSATVIFGKTCLGNSLATAYSETTLADNEAEIYSAFNEIEDLVSYISINENASFEELSTKNSSIVENVTTEAVIALNTQETLNPPIFGAFLWGCCYGPLGIVVVSVCTNNDKDQVRQAANGCIVFNISAAIVYVLSYLLLESSYASTL
jgi:hypothetical protein